VVYIHVTADWADIFDTPKKTRENASQAPLHTVSRKHVETIVIGAFDLKQSCAD